MVDSAVPTPIPAAITKAELAKAARYYGQRNKKTFGAHAAESLVYTSFIGALNPVTGLYEGAHHFNAAGKSTAPVFDFKEIPKCL